MTDMLKIRTYALVRDANGVPDIISQVVTLNTVQYQNGDHYQFVEEHAGNEGYEFLGAFDENDRAGKKMVYPPGHEDAVSALGECITQLEQMKGMFDDDDGAIQAAIEDGNAALEQTRTSNDAHPVVVAQREDSITLETGVNCSTWESNPPIKCRFTITSADLANIFRAANFAQEYGFPWIEVSMSKEPAFEMGDSSEEAHVAANFRVACGANEKNGSVEIYVFGQSTEHGAYLDSTCVLIPASFATDPDAAMDYLAENYEWVWRTPQAPETTDDDPFQMKG